MLTVSPEGRKFIETKEGLRLEAYQDIVGIWTIGYGHTGPDVHPGMVITKDQADQMLTDRLHNEFEPAVDYLIGDAPTTQNQFDAMVSLAYNIGTGETEQMRVEHIRGEHGFAGSSVLRYHNLQDYFHAASSFLLWDKAGGEYVEALNHRRKEESDIYLKGDYSAN